MKKERSPTRKPGNRIARKLVLWAVITGLAASILLTMFELFLDYRQRQQLITESIDEIGTTFLPSLAKSIWAFNLPQVRLQIEAIIQQPTISSAELHLNDGSEPQKFGNIGSNDHVIGKTFDISYNNHRNESIPLGHLVLRKDFSEEQSALVRSGLTRFIGNSIVIAVIAYSILHIFQIMVTHRLERMASRWRDVSEEDLRNQHRERPPTDSTIPIDGDELDDLGRVIEILFTTGARALREADEKEQVLIDLKKKADAASTAKSEFLANMSHEIRTPMNGVTGIAELLMNTDLSRNQALLVRHLNASANNLLLIINDILDFSRIESGQLEIEPTPCDIDDMIRDIAYNFTPLALQKGIDLICPASPPVNRRILIDGTRTRQVLINLLSNAVKFTTHGEVALYYSCKSAGDGSLLLRFEVADTGPGIPDTMQDHLFERFTQADTSVTRKYGGTGLGLAISKRLVQLMGGDIGYHSSDQGTRFWFSLGATGCEPHREVSKNEHPQERLLIIDQNGTNLRFLTETLALWGVDVEALSQPGETVERLTSAQDAGSPFTRVLIDHRLAAISSQVLAQQIRQQPACSMLPVLLMSYDLLLSEETLPGFDAVINKPIQPESLHALLFGQDQATASDGGTRFAAGQRFDARILIAEDNPTNRLVVESMMRHLGVRFDSASNGREAINLLERFPYDMVFMDCQMPVMDGYQATREIRTFDKGPFNPDIPIIAMTANALVDDKGKCQAAGMNDYLAKPINLEQVSLMIARWLPAKKQTEKEGPTSPNTGLAREPASSQVFNEQSMSALLMHDEALISSVIETFMSDIPSVIEQLRADVEAGKLEAASRSAHRIKGAADNVGGRALRSVARSMETAAKMQDQGESLRLFKELEHAFTRLQEALQTRLMASTQ